MIFAKAESYRAVHADRCVLLDGCFDPVHHGHVRQIRAARRLFHGLSLVVGVAADADIRQKGREPLFGQMTRCAIVDALQGVDVVIAKDRPLSDLIAVLKPVALVKGKDWEGRLPEDVQAACALYDARVVYVGDPLDSSTDRLRTWAAIEDATHLERFEQIVQGQQPAAEPWHPVTDYSFEARKEIEGIHPQLILEAFQPKRVLDAGCGPGHLVRMLRERGVEAYGFDLNPPNGPNGQWFDYDDLCSDLPLDEWNTTPLIYDLVINRECLEHLTIRKIPQAVANLCKLSSKFVYVTTRFVKSPAHLLKVDTKDDLDPTHVSMLNQGLLRALFVLNGGKRRKDLEERLDWQNKGRVLVYEV